MNLLHRFKSAAYCCGLTCFLIGSDVIRSQVAWAADDKPGQAKPATTKKTPVAIKAGGVVRFMAFNHDNTLLATSGDGKVAVWDVANGKQVASCQNKPQDLLSGSVVFSPTDQKLAFTHASVRPLGQNNRIEIWDMKSKKSSVTIKDLLSYINEMAFSPDGKLLAAYVAGGMTPGGTVNIWDTETGKVVHVIEKSDFVLTLRFDTSGKYLFSAGIGGVRGWDVATGKEVVQHFHKNMQHSGLAINRGATQLVTSRGEMVQFDLQLGEHSSIKEAKAYQLNNLTDNIDGKDIETFSPDGALIAIGRKKWVRFWDLNTGTEIPALKTIVAKDVDSLAFSNDSQTLAIGMAGGTVQVQRINK